MTYLRTLALTAYQGLAQLVRAPSHSRRALARQHLAKRWLILAACGAAIVLALMFAVDLDAITAMPMRGTPNLWPVRVFTDFGKAAYVLEALGLLVILTLLIAPLRRGRKRIVLLAIARRLAFCFLAVVVPVEIGEIIKGIIGRGRPFVGGVANPFNYSHFAWTEAYASFPSGHAITAFALAFAVSSVWPRAAVLMWIYALMIAASRIVLLAHHPSDVVAGAFVGVLGAMVVRYGFASRRLLFTIGPAGTIHPLGSSGLSGAKIVAEGAAAP